MVKENTCYADGKESTAEHHLKAASGDLTYAYDIIQEWIAIGILPPIEEEDQVATLTGAILHTFDELLQLAEGLNIEGVRHPDHPGS
jgi:hypothetical protein